jgi:capsid portal protein
MKLRISNLSVSDLENKGSFLDKQDPAVQLTIGSSTYTTARYFSIIAKLYKAYSDSIITI